MDGAQVLKEEIARLKALLGEYAKRVPPAVNSGSYNLAVSYKADIRSANKLLAKERPSVLDLQASINKLDAYWKLK